MTRSGPVLCGICLFVLVGIGAGCERAPVKPQAAPASAPLVAPAQPSPQAATPFRSLAKPQVLPQLLEAGEGFHGDEVKARSGEQWLGLFVTEAGSELRETTLRIRFVHDAIVDEGNQATGKSVRVNSVTQPLFLLRNVAAVVAGPVKTIFHVAPLERHSLSDHPVVSLKLGTQTYELKLVGEKATSDAFLPRHPRLVLTDGLNTQMLLSLEEDEIENLDWSLQWAGDLDGDGKLDLYADLPEHYNVSRRKLFLSTYAKPGQLVAEVAEFVTTGC